MTLPRSLPPTQEERFKTIVETMAPGSINGLLKSSRPVPDQGGSGGSQQAPDIPVGVRIFDVKNTAAGADAMPDATGSKNTGFGASALTDETSGSENTAVGYFALRHIDTGVSNTAVGSSTYGSGDASFTTGVGADASMNGDNATALGFGALAVQDATAVGSAAVANGTGAVSIGAHAAGNGTHSVAVLGFAIAPSSVAIGDGASVALGAYSYAAAVGANTDATAAGAVAIGCDSGGAGAQATSADAFVLGTANHNVSIPGDVGFHGHAPVAQSATPVTLADVIAVLQAHGLCA